MYSKQINKHYHHLGVKCEKTASIEVIMKNTNLVRQILLILHHVTGLSENEWIISHSKYNSSDYCGIIFSTIAECSLFFK